MTRALPLYRERAPGDPDGHVFESAHGWHVLVADGSRVYDVDAGFRARVDEIGLAAALDEAGAPRVGFLERASSSEPPVKSLSLAVAQACNMGCSYCYAHGGDFGKPSRAMPWETVRAAIDSLIDGANGERVHLAFLGGEPLLARDVIHRATEYAAARGRVGFSITTNGTLVTPEDAALFEEHGFAVTVSLDGVGETHDALRPLKSGQPTFARILERVAPLLASQRRMQVSARVTVTPQNLAIRDTVTSLIALGFHSVGVSPMLRAPSGKGELAASHAVALLDAMTDCGREFERRALRGERWPFSNLTTALREIHRGTHRPYPCGAGAGYFGVSADGDLFACHRFIEDDAGRMGTIATGVDRARQRTWLEARHVDRQEPCRTCWARYLCGGGCHHEVIARGRVVCDYIRGWLDFCLRTYVHILEQRPDYLVNLV